MSGSVFDALRRHLASAEHVDISQYEFINLAAVREAAGDNWANIKSRVFVAAESIIESHLADEDLVIRCASGYLVVFHDTSGLEAQALTETIRQELQTFFLGEDLTRPLSVEAEFETMSVAEFAAKLDAAEVEETEISDSARKTVREIGERRQIDDTVFWPAWNPKQEAVAAFAAVGRKTRQDQAGWMLQDEILGQGFGPADRLAIDLQVLTQAQSELKTLTQQRLRCGVIVPVGYSVIAHGPSRIRFASTLTQMPDELRKLVFLNVENAPVDAPASQVNESCRSVLNCCGRLMIRAPLDALSLERFRDSGASLVGARLPAHYKDSLPAQIERFTAIARRLGVPIYLDGIRDWNALKAALASPAQLLIGPTFGEQSKLSAPHKLSRARALSLAA